MAKRKLTKTVAGAAGPKTVPYELRDTIIPGFLLKVTPATVLVSLRLAIPNLR